MHRPSLLVVWGTASPLSGRSSKGRQHLPVRSVCVGESSFCLLRQARLSKELRGKMRPEDWPTHSPPSPVSPSLRWLRWPHYTGWLQLRREASCCIGPLRSAPLGGRCCLLLLEGLVMRALDPLIGIIGLAGLRAAAALGLADQAHGGQVGGQVAVEQVAWREGGRDQVVM